MKIHLATIQHPDGTVGIIGAATTRTGAYAYLGRRWADSGADGIVGEVAEVELDAGLAQEPTGPSRLHCPECGTGQIWTAPYGTYCAAADGDGESGCDARWDSVGVRE